MRTADELGLSQPEMTALLLVREKLMSEEYTYFNMNETGACIGGKMALEMHIGQRSPHAVLCRFARDKTDWETPMGALLWGKLDEKVTQIAAGQAVLRVLKGATYNEVWNLGGPIAVQEAI